MEFFLKGVTETAQNSIEAFQKILKLWDKIERNNLHSLGRKQVLAKKLIMELYKQPVLDGAQIAALIDVHASTANRLIRDFEQLGILKELTGYKRNRIYIFDEYVKLF